MDQVTIKTHNKIELIDITNEIQNCITKSGIKEGVAIVFIPHTTAGVTINEGADPAVQDDLIQALKHITPALKYRHMEGNSPAHIQTSLIGSSVLVPVEESKVCLGTWQRIFFCEFDGPRTRKIWIKTCRSQ